MNFLQSSDMKIHCIGIGGIGLSGLAEFLYKKGYQVSGSDLEHSVITERLKNLGMIIEQGHSTNLVESADLVIYSSAIQESNLELVKAKEKNCVFISRGELLADLMRPCLSIAVVGTHGKTTTTGILAHTFVTAELDPHYVIGGRICGQATSIRLGTSGYFIVEGDESDQSFLYMNPKIAVVTNIEADHLENYHGDFEALQQSFLQFISGLPEDGLVVLGVDCPVLRSLLPRIKHRVVTFGFSESADFCAYDVSIQGLQSYLKVRIPSSRSLSLCLNLPGEHNILNALATVVVANEIGISDDCLVKSFREFPGMDRRFYSHGELLLACGKILLFEDYGHHPTAIESTLSMAKAIWPHRRVVLVFQPHRYTRTRDLMSDFVRVLGRADSLILLDVYAANEAYDKSGSTKQLCIELSKKHIVPIFIPEFDQVVEQLPYFLRADDVVLFQGAGNVGSLALKLKESQ